MIGRRSLIARVALLGTLGVLAFPGEGLALRPTFVISLTPTGPSPSVLTIPAGVGPVSFSNTDTATHTIAFANGSCSAEVAPGTTSICGVSQYVGDYAYTVDGTAQASVTVTPEWRAVTLKAKRHGFRRDSKVRLYGRLAIANLSPPSLYGPRMPVTIFERPPGHHLWYRLAVVMAKPLKRPHLPAHSVWQLWVRPRRGTTYLVAANSQPTGGQYWQNALSRPFGVYMRHRR